MAKRRWVQHVLSPWFLAPLCLGTGAAVVLTVLGVPDLWTAEAAGWASAFGTTAAALVALWVGVFPERNRRREGAIRASVQMHVTAASLETQLLHVSAAIRRSRDELLDSEDRQAISSAMEKFGPESVALLINFAEHLGDDALTKTSRCLVDMHRVESMMRTLRSIGPELLAGGGWLTDVLVASYLSMDDARIAYSSALGRKPAVIPKVPEEVTAARALEG